jgi:ribosomal subunit interface protein
MKINIKATNIELTSEIERYVNDKVNTIDKFLNHDESFAYIEVGKTTNHHKQGDIFKAEIDIRAGEEKYFASSETEDLYTAINLAKEEILSTLKSIRGRKQTLFRRGAKSVKKMMKGLTKRNPFTSKY